VRHGRAIAVAGFALVACTARPKPATVVVTMPSSIVSAPSPDDARRAARRLRDEGKLDVAARVFAAIDAGPELDALRADAWRAEPVTALRPVDVAFAKRVHDAFAARSFDAIRSELERAAETRDVDPEILAWLGRASQGVAAHRAYARARARLEELGFQLELPMLKEPKTTNIGFVGPNRLVRTTMTTRPSSTMWDGYFEIWDLGATEPWRTVPTKDVTPVHGFGASPGRFMMVRNYVDVREPELGSEIMRIPLMNAWGMAVSKRTGRIAVIESPQTVELFEPDGKKLATITSADPIRLAASDDGTKVAVAGLDGATYIGGVDLPTKKLPSVAEPGVYAAGLTFRDEGRELVVLFSDGLIVTFDVATARVKSKRRRTCTPEEFALLNETQPPTYRVSGPPSAAQLESCGGYTGGDDAALDDSLMMSQHGSFTLVRRTGSNAPLPRAPLAEQIGVDGQRYVLAKTLVHAFEVRDAESGKILASAPRRGIQGAVRDLSANGRFLAVDDALWDVKEGRETMPRQARSGARFLGAGAKHVRWAGTSAEIVDSATGAVERTLSHQEEVRDADASANGARIVTSAGAAFVWSESGQLVRRIDELHEIVGAHLSADGRVVATCNLDGSVRFYTVDDGRLLVATPKPPTYTGKPFPAAVSPDGTLGATTTSEYPILRVHVFDLRSGREVRTIDVERPATAIAFLPNGSDIAISTQSDLPLVVFDVGTGKEKARTNGDAGTLVPERVVPSLDGRTVRISMGGVYQGDADMTVVRTDGGGSTLQVRALATGGWIAQSGGGAIAGSPDAHVGLGTSAVKGTQLLYFSADLIWDALEAPDLVPRALGGERVKPLGL
jgi:hypothetical protein